MAKSHCERVRGVQMVRDFIETKYSLQHIRHLFLRGCTVARYGLLDFTWRILDERNVTGKCRRNAQSLSPAEFQHRLHVLAEERSLDGKHIRLIDLDNRRNLIKQYFHLRTHFHLRSQNYTTHSQEFCLFSPLFDYRITSYVRSRVYSEYPFLFCKLHDEILLLSFVPKNACKGRNFIRRCDFSIIKSWNNKTASLNLKTKPDNGNGNKPNRYRK